MKERDYINLELDKVVEMAVAYAACHESKTTLQEERIQTDTETVRLLLQQTDTLASHLLKNGSLRLSACEGAKDAVLRAHKGGILSMAELLRVAVALQNFRRLHAWFTPGEAPNISLSDLFFSLTPQPVLEENIRASILSEHEMADHASAELADIRRKIRLAENSIRDKLEQVLKNPKQNQYLQENLVSLRNGRYVVPVKSEHRGEIGGVIHDVSQSGGTLFVEPSAVVEANAKILQLKNAEQAEIERILGEFSQEISDISPFFHASYTAMIELDMRLAKAELGLSMRGICPQICENMCFSLQRARHPLLNRDSVVPVDISLGENSDTMVITGPNTGGKTVTLKTAGLLCAMGQMGYLLPAADSSSLCVFKEIYADIGDEQSIEQSLSTFSGHIRNITDILQSAGPRSLVLLDELGAGTDPAEGAALAVSIIERLRALGAHVMATTHYAELKLFALDTPGVQNAGCEFNVETLRPTYRLVVGVPGRSNAFFIGERLGLSSDVIDNARRHLSHEQRRFETVLGQLEEMKREVQEKEDEIEKLRHLADHEMEQARQKQAALIQQGEDELAASRRKAKALSDEVENRAFQLMDEMKRLEKDKRKNETQKAQRAREIARKEAGKIANIGDFEETQEALSFVPLTEVKQGQEVWVPRMNKIAVVTAVADKNNLVQVRIGALRTKLPLSDLSKHTQSGKDKNKGKSQKGHTSLTRHDGVRSPQTELHLLGKTVDEALLETDLFIDHAIMQNLSPVYIIHGRGTGALRTAITQHLRQHKNVASFRLGRYGEGEDGVTVAELK